MADELVASTNIILKTFCNSHQHFLVFFKYRFNKSARVCYSKTSMQMHAHVQTQKGNISIMPS